MLTYESQHAKKDAFPGIQVYSGPLQLEEENVMSSELTTLMVWK